MKQHFCKLYILLILLWSERALAEILFAPTQTELSVGRSAEFYFDTTAKLDWPEISKTSEAWIRSEEDNPRFDNFSGNIWIKLPLHLEGEGAVFLEIRHALLDQLKFYWQTESGVSEGLAGDHKARSEWTLSTRFPSFRMQAPAKGVLWIKAQSGTTLLFPLVLKREQVFYDKIRDDEVIQALYFGGILTIALYNLLVGAMTGLPVYGFYVIFLLGYAAYQSGMSGHWAFYVLPNAPFMNDMMPILGMLIGMTGSVYFSGLLLEIKEKYRTQRWMQRYMPVLTLLVLACQILSGTPLALQMTMLLGVFPWLCYLVWTGYVSLKSGERVAKWYVSAWAFFVMGSVFTLLRVKGLVPNTFFTVYAQQIGSAIEFILFSFAMADRIKFLQEQVHKEQSLALHSEIAARAADLRALEASEKALEEQKRLAELKDQFLANTSHELRTPLNGLIGLAQSLLERSLGTVQDQEHIRQMVRSGQRLHSIVSELLDFSSLRQGKMELSSEDIDLKASVAAVKEFFREELEAKGLSCSDQTLSLDPWVVGDQLAVHKVLKAIISNAMKFTDHGEISIEAREHEQVWDLAISDTGCGMSPEKVLNLEATFEQGDGSSTRKQGGTGIGLALAVHLIRKMGGEVKVISQLRLGTTVILSFRKAEAKTVSLRQASALTTTLQQTGTEAVQPQAVRPKVSRALSLVSDPTPRKPTRRSKVLIVDDDEVNRLVLMNFLNLGPYDLEEAESGAQALTKMESDGPFDAILCDVMMPGMSGFEVCQQLRKTYDNLKLPILLLTAMQQTENIVKGFNAGANDYLIKPIQKDELFARLATQLAMSRYHSVMRRFVPQDIISLLGHQSLEDVHLGEAVERDMAVMFADIRSFTSKLEHLPPHEAFQWLNKCYAVVGPIVRRYGGFIDKYIGDAVLALFPADPDAAVDALIDMHRGIRELGAEYWVGVGFHKGPTVIGTLGEPERYEATVLSDTVNVASRIEGISKKLQAHVLVSENFYKSLTNPLRWNWRCLGPIGVKGRSAKIVVYELLDASEEAELKISSKEDFAEAVRLFQNGDFEQSLLLFETLAQKSPTDQVVLLFREKAEEFSRKGQTEGACLDFDSKD